MVYDETGEGVVIDPGCYEDLEKEELSGFIKGQNISIKYLINTHCHIDHVFGNYFIKEKYKVPFIMHKLDLEILRAVKVYAPSYGFTHFDETEPDSFIDEGETVSFGNSQFEILFVPGHAPGHIALYNSEEKICLSGDVLFNESIGRTDLPGGNHDTLIDSIRTKMFALDDEMVIYPGHGETTTIGHEKRTNPFCRVL